MAQPTDTYRLSFARSFNGPFFSSSFTESGL